MTTILKATIPGTEVRTIKSSSTHFEYRISVALPRSYCSKPRKRYPTIYLLDANDHFGLVTELTRTMAGPRFPETIVVGIGYPVDDDGRWEAASFHVGKLRFSDLTPVVDRKMEEDIAKANKVDIRTGGSGKFLKFIQTELIPVIQADHRAGSTGRILMGHSLGGLFVCYALLHQPKLFNGYLAADPSLFYRDRAMFNMERRFARAHKTLSVKLYLGIGEPEKEHSPSDMVSNMLQFAARLESRHYKGFTLTRQVHFDCDHGSVIAPAYQAGLQAVLG
jgi:predicted alpha/beta superfamily hydrolase